MDVGQAKELIASVKGKTLSRPQRGELATTLAAGLLYLARNQTTMQETRDLKKIAVFMKDPSSRELLTAIADRFFRSDHPSKCADELIYLFKTFGTPKLLPLNEKIKIVLFRLFGKPFAKIVIPLFKKRVQSEFSNVILPENKEALSLYIKKSKEKGVEINVNRLGEAILGEGEAAKRIALYKNDLLSPEIGYISIKDSTLFSQINLVGWEKTVSILSERLRELYRSSISHFYLKTDGSPQPKFIYLDMEEYKDLDLTLAIFQKVLDEQEFLTTSAGIVLQSYLPNSFEALQKLTDWAMKRVERGGAPIRVRIVKGANREMERVESSLKGWECAVFPEKIETDANFKRMVEFALQKDHAKGVHVGLGSHNLFDIAYALLLRSEQGTENEATFEMLAGMAPPLMRVVGEVAGGMLLYSPTVQPQAYYTAIAYLIRRLDENSGKENFLHELFDLRATGSGWEGQKKQFLKSLENIPSLPSERRRKQNRASPPHQPPLATPFANEADTDFSLQENRQWAKEIFASWEKRKEETVPLILGGEQIAGNPLISWEDPSQPGRTTHRYPLATTQEIDAALQCAKNEEKRWGSTTSEERSKLLWQTAQKLRENRANLIGAMLANGAKPVTEGDAEVSEAIDFCEYYRRSFEKISRFHDVSWTPKGTFLVAPPWNFPCSIPTGGIAAALMAGNCVIFKPAPQAVLVGWWIASAFWEAGVSKKVLQFLTCRDEPEGDYFISHSSLSGVILTGGTATAHHFIALKPGLDLIAETGGKNAIIATGMCDRDLAIRDVISSAFSYAGQKCSACSLLILEKELYDNPAFLHHLKDAAKSYYNSSAWDPMAKLPPLIQPPGETLQKGLTTLEEGESWLLEPAPSPHNPCLWSPGIKLGVRKGNFTHQTELFGPVLGVIRAENLHHAIEIANATPYGLTSGLHSLDEREQELWKNEIIAGNLYINRGITGAIVRRQPFGGCKASSFGPGGKAGGPNYIVQLMHPQQQYLPKENEKLPPEMEFLFTLFPLNEEEKTLLRSSASSYTYWAQVLKELHDSSPLLGQDNFFYHVPRRTLIRFTQHDAFVDLLRSAAAALAAGSIIDISSFDRSQEPLHALSHVRFSWEHEGEFKNRVEKGEDPYIRTLSTPSEDLKLAASKGKAVLITAPVLANGRFELLHYLREVSLSIDHHRYGHIREVKK